MPSVPTEAVVNRRLPGRAAARDTCSLPGLRDLRPSPPKRPNASTLLGSLELDAELSLFAESVAELCPLAQEAFDDPRDVEGAQYASQILANVDPPTQKYLRACERKAAVPLPLPFVTGSSSCLRAKGRTLKDKDLDAIATMLPETKVQEIDLQGNSGLSAAALLGLMEALGRGAATLTLKQLDLSGCVRFGQSPGLPLGALVGLLSDSRQGLERLQRLDLSGVSLSVRLQLPLCEAIREHETLHTLSLADTQLGAGAGVLQAGADLGGRCVQELLGCETLRSLDLSWNCFSGDVFSQLGWQLVETQRLTSLNVAGCSSACLERPGEEITPAALLIERLSHVSSLTSLDLSLSRLDHRGALVLEDALQQVPSMSTLNVAHNPMGVLGIRCLVRLLSRTTSGLRHFDCEDCSTGEAGEADGHLVFYASHPGGYYPLDLAKPYHRALLRMLYKTSELFGFEPSDCFREVTSTPKYEHPRKDAHGVFQVPTSGSLSFTFTLEKVSESHPQESEKLPFSDFLERHTQLTSSCPPDKKVVPLLAQWRRLYGRDQERVAILDAVAKDFRFTPAQLEQFCREPGSDVAEILARLLPCVTGGKPGLFLSLLASPTIDDYARALSGVRTWLLFNADNPTGRYRFDLREPADHCVAGKLILLDNWEASLARMRKRQDTSQHGNRSQVRNALYNNDELARLFARADGSARPIWEWCIPERGMLLIDYASLRRPPKGAEVLDEVIFDSVLQTLQSPDPAPPEHRLQALRGCSHLIHVTSMQLRAILDSFQDESLRAEAFVTLFNRVADMHNEKVFRVRFEREVDSLRSRLGFATYFPFMQPEQCTVRLDLSYHDQRLAAQFIISLHFRERISNIQNPSYMVDGVVRKEEIRKGIPRTWEALDRMPRVGVFSCSYKCAEAHRCFKFRKEFMIKYGGWDVDHVGPEDVMWWVSLSRAPEAAIYFIEFLNVHFTNITEPVKKMDCLACDGALSSGEFLQGCERIGYHRAKGPGGKEHLEAIFNWLDIGEQRELDVADTVSLLECAYQEVKVNIREFVQFCERVVGSDIDDFWSMLSGGDNERSLSMQDFSDRVKELGFFAPPRAIFMFLSSLDQGGMLSRDAFMQRLAVLWQDKRHRSLTGVPDVHGLHSRATSESADGIGPNRGTLRE